MKFITGQGTWGASQNRKWEKRVCQRPDHAWMIWDDVIGKKENNYQITSTCFQFVQL